jgi:phosphotransferase system HPr-like phosphotransfer protein
MQYRREVKTILPVLLSDKEQLVLARPAAKAVQAVQQFRQQMLYRRHRQCRCHISLCSNGSMSSIGSIDNIGSIGIQVV